MIFDYRFEQYLSWEENQNISFQRKLENETAFDGIVKIYSVKTNSDLLNKLLENKFFGDFYYASETGIFLRMFDNKESWPNTTLIFIDLKKITLTEVLKTKSSWNVWNAKDLGHSKYSIAISPTETVEFEALQHID
jgi:hypothetical protein